MSHHVFYGDLVYKLRLSKEKRFHLVGFENSQTPSSTTVWPLIIKRTIGLVLGPYTASYRPFIKHCNLNKKAFGTLWRALSRHSQRWQGPDLCPLWLIVGILQPSDLSSLPDGRNTACPIRMSLYIFLISLLPMLFVYRFLWPLRLVWLLVCCLYKEVYIYKFLNVCPFDYTTVAANGRVGPVNQLTTPVGLLLFLQLTVLSRSATFWLLCRFMFSLCLFDISIDTKRRVKNLESYSGHTLCFYLTLVKYRFNNVFLKKYFTLSSTVI